MFPPFRFSEWNSACTSHAYYMPHTFHPPLPDHPNNIWWSVSETVRLPWYSTHKTRTTLYHVFMFFTMYNHAILLSDMSDTRNYTVETWDRLQWFKFHKNPSYCGNIHGIWTEVSFQINGNITARRAMFSSLTVSDTPWPHIHNNNSPSRYDA
jgi:hypothetical protein